MKIRPRDGRQVRARRSLATGWLALVLLALAISITAAGAAVPDDLRAAARLRDEGDLAASASAYRAILEADPENLEAMRGLALVLSWDGQYDDAIEMYGRVLKTAPSDAEARLGLARTYSWSSRLDESIAAYDAYLADHPDDQATVLEAAKVRSWAEQYDEAIGIYRAHLEARPDDRDVRLELARVLSWDGQFDASIAEHRRLVEADPGDQEARLGLARVLSWAGRSDESVEEYRALLAASPDDRDVRLGLAQTLAWDGRYKESVEQYEEILARDPEDDEAAVGLGRALSWSGDLEGAEEQYDAVLARDPDNADALVGKAQIAYWRGDTRSARRELARAEQAAPGNRDAADLRERLNRGQRPLLDSGYTSVIDTDGNHYNRFHASVEVGLRPEISLRGIYTRTEAGLEPAQNYGCEAAPGRWAHVDSLAAAAGFVLPGDVRLTAELGADRVENSTGGTTTRAVGRVFAHGPIRGSWRWNGGIERRTFDATRVILDCGIAYDMFRAGASGDVKKWPMSADIGLMDFSDGNRRVHVGYRASRPFVLKGVTLEPGYAFRAMRYDENLDHGYFDPQRYFSNLATLVVRGPIGTPRVDYTVRLEFGLQSFEVEENTVVGLDGMPRTLVGFEQRNDTVFGGEVRIGWNVLGRGRLEAFYARTDYAAQNPTGFESEGWGLVFRYRF